MTETLKKFQLTVQNFLRDRHYLITIFLLVIICFSFIFSLNQKSSLIKPYNPQHWEDEYNKSQWMVKKNPHIITDEALYTHVGGLLIKGYDPSLINAEVPPFGKYVLGWFNATTGYLGIYGVVFSVLSLVLLFVLNRLLFRSTVAALIPVTLFSFDPIFTDQIAAGLLDSLYLCLLLATFIFFLRKKYLLTAITAGLFMATKSPFIIILLYLALISYMLLRKEFSLKRVVIMTSLTGLIYILTHIQLFMLGHDLRYFLSVQKYMIHFYQIGAKGVFGAVIPLLFTGYWITWYGKNMFIEAWSILWPVVSLLGVMAGYKLLSAKAYNNNFILIICWSILYFGFLCITPIFARYLLLLLPFLYNLSVWLILPDTASKSA